MVALSLLRKGRSQVAVVADGADPRFFPEPDPHPRLTFAAGEIYDARSRPGSRARPAALRVRLAVGAVAPTEVARTGAGRADGRHGGATVS
jgi:hypothetical protein